MLLETTGARLGYFVLLALLLFVAELLASLLFVAELLALLLFVAE